MASNCGLPWPPLRKHRQIDKSNFERYSHGLPQWEATVGGHSGNTKNQESKVKESRVKRVKRVNSQRVKESKVRESRTKESKIKKSIIKSQRVNESIKAR